MEPTVSSSSSVSSRYPIELNRQATASKDSPGIEVEHVALDQAYIWEKFPRLLEHLRIYDDSET
jgi:hypothetical protein